MSNVFLQTPNPFFNCQCCSALLSELARFAYQYCVLQWITLFSSDETIHKSSSNALDLLYYLLTNQTVKYTAIPSVQHNHVKSVFFFFKVGLLISGLLTKNVTNILFIDYFGFTI